MYLKFINFTYSKNILIDGVAITVGIITFKTFQRIKMKSIDIGIFSLIYVNETLWRLDHSIKDWKIFNCIQNEFFCQLGCLIKTLNNVQKAYDKLMFLGLSFILFSMYAGLKSFNWTKDGPINILCFQYQDRI